jgi:hypothetical protein
MVEHNMGKTGGTGTAAVDSLPDYFYRQLSLKLFADYALKRNSGIRADFIIDHRSNNDWTWQNWSYGQSPALLCAPLGVKAAPCESAISDGTTVRQPGSEKTAFLGVMYYYRWR